MSIAKYDGLIRFDADDIMLPNMVETIMKNRGGQGAVRFRLKNFGMNTDTSFAMGQIYVKHSVFDEFGGYKPWVCAADTDFKKRIEKFTKIKILSDVLMKRRVHQESLTRSKKTDKNSAIRAEYRDKIANMKIRSKKDAIIYKETNTCKEIIATETQPIRIILEPKQVVKRPVPKKEVKKPVVKKKQEPKTMSKFHKGKPNGSGWNEFFGL
jgi:hypothetical protein